MEILNKLVRTLTPVRVILLSFALLILSGSLLLMLPLSSAEGRWTSFADALFTATSASCVTGLVVHDTATYWSHFGQLVILLLIQVGGLGVVTMTIMVTQVLGKRIGLVQRNLMQESISAPHIQGILRLTRFIFRVTFTIEGIGTVCMMPVFIPSFGLAEGLWKSFFHSISAFCNAGFDLMGTQAKFSSLLSYRSNPVINLVIMALIVLGGIGFFTWSDVAEQGLRLRRYRMQSKVVLLVTAVLIVFPAVYFFFGEFQGESLGTRIWASLFQAVTPRTAGFNTMDYTAMSEVGILVTILLMLAGGSPASTAGGMKLTTVAVLVACAQAVFRQKKDVELCQRRVPEDAIRAAVAVLVLYAGLFILGAAAMSRLEGLPLLTCLFETASAIATVGLTLGATPTLSVISRLILVALMYLGRVGGLTLVFAAVTRESAFAGRHPEEKISIG